MPRKISVEDLVARLNEKRAYDLLVTKLPEISPGKTRWHALAGKEADDAHDLKRAYVNRAIAARSFESMDSFGEAAFSYDRAATAADALGYALVVLKCRVRACKIYDKLRKKKELEYAQKHILKIVKKHPFDIMVTGISWQNSDLVQIVDRKKDAKKIPQILPHERRSVFSRDGKVLLKNFVREAFDSGLSDEELDARFNGNKR